jgi:hypothetical protein
VKPDRILPFSELPADADLDAPYWSFSHGGPGGVIHHCTEDCLTDYPIPKIISQIVEIHEQHAMEAVRAPLRKALKDIGL